MPARAPLLGSSLTRYTLGVRGVSGAPVPPGTAPGKDGARTSDHRVHRMQPRLAAAKEVLDVSLSGSVCCVWWVRGEGRGCGGGG